MKMDVMRQPLSLTFGMFGLLAVLLYAHFLVWPLPEELATESLLPIEAFIKRFSVSFPLLSLITSMLLVFYNGLALSRILSRHMVFASRTYIPITIYLVISCGIWFAGANLAATIAAFLLVRGTEYLLSSFVRHTTFNLTFKGALLLGLIPLVHPPAVLYMTIIPLGLPLLKRKGREVITAIVAVVLPLLTYAYVMWIVDYGFLKTFVSFGERLSVPAGLPLIEFGTAEDIVRIVCICLAGALTLAGLAGFAISSGKMRTRARTIFIYFLVILALGCVSLFIPAASINDLMMLSVPLSIMIPAAFAQFPGWFTWSLYILLMLAVTVLNAYPFLFA